MKALVVYDTVSPKKLTMKVAETIVSILKDRGLEVDSSFVENIDLAAVKNYDCVVVGAPTMYFNATKGIMQFLDSFKENEFSGKSAAAFDTQLQGRFYGNAAKAIDNKLRKLGFEIIAPPLVTYVEGKKEEMHLKEGGTGKSREIRRRLGRQTKSVANTNARYPMCRYCHNKSSIFSGLSASLSHSFPSS